MSELVFTLPSAFFPRVFDDRGVPGVVLNQVHECVRAWGRDATLVALRDMVEPFRLNEQDHKKLAGSSAMVDALHTEAEFACAYLERSIQYLEDPASPLPIQDSLAKLVQADPAVAIDALMRLYKSQFGDAIPAHLTNRLKAWVKAWGARAIVKELRSLADPWTWRSARPNWNNLQACIRYLEQKHADELLDDGDGSNARESAAHERFSAEKLGSTVWDTLRCGYWCDAQMAEIVRVCGRDATFAEVRTLADSWAKRRPVVYSTSPMDETEMVDAYHGMAIERWLKRLQDPTYDVSHTEIVVPRYSTERNGSDVRLLDY